MFKSGDTYIHFTRYGGINTGIVDIYYEVESIDTKNKMCYFVPHIRTTKKIVLCLDGTDGKIYRVDTNKTAKWWLQLMNNIEKVQGIKKHVEFENMLKTGNITHIR